jgi:hypothetical protein
VLFTYEKAQSFGLDDIDEMQIIEKAQKKNVYYNIEGESINDSNMNAYLNGTVESATI